ncbi:MAG: ABC transporter ATP-binding protein [Lachnospiraceae bacterium]|nr:ABC transporter ATP-binding protein [Lachnospiraceae bacterium]
MLEMKNVYKDFPQGDFTVNVLKHINIRVKEGDYVAITGPSGSGKTTMMNLIGCLDTVTKGSMILDGEDVSTYTDNQLSDLRLNKIGFVFQTFELLGQKSALKNVCVPLAFAKVPKKEQIERATEALQRVGLGDRLDFKPNQLSGGQKQRVAIARAMIQKPRILLADEPTGALDSASGQSVMELFEQLNNEGTTIIMITHDSDVAAKAHRRAVMKDGVLTSDDEDLVPPYKPEEEVEEDAK